VTDQHLKMLLCAITLTSKHLAASLCSAQTCSCFSSGIRPVIPNIYAQGCICVFLLRAVYPSRVSSFLVRFTKHLAAAAAVVSVRRCFA